jgi:hypothetical protein
MNFDVGDRSTKKWGYNMLQGFKLAYYLRLLDHFDVAYSHAAEWPRETILNKGQSKRSQVGTNSKQQRPL